MVDNTLDLAAIQTALENSAAKVEALIDSYVDKKSS